MKRVLLCAVLMTWSCVSSATVYKWVDAQGKTQYGDLPPDGVHAEVVEMPGNHSLASPAPSPKAKTPTTLQSSVSTPANAATQAEAQKAVADDVAQARDKQCADAQDRYKKLIEGRKLYKAGPDGERQYLSSEEIDSERLNAKRDVDSICNSPT